MKDEYLNMIVQFAWDIINKWWKHHAAKIILACFVLKNNKKVNENKV